MKSCFSSKHFIRWWFITVVVSLQCCKVPQPLAQMASNGQSDFVRPWKYISKMALSFHDANPHCPRFQAPSLLTP